MGFIGISLKDVRGCDNMKNIPHEDGSPSREWIDDAPVKPKRCYMQLTITAILLIAAFMAGTIYSTGEPYGVAKKCAVEQHEDFIAFLDRHAP